MEKAIYISSSAPEDHALALKELHKGIYAALETYANVHRGSGFNSMVSTSLYEQARDIVLEYMGLKKSAYVVIFCSPRRAAMFTSKIKPKNYREISSRELGLSVGVRAIAVRRSALPKGDPFESGGGTTKLTAKDWIIWAGAPDRFEAGTPPVMNVITFTKALLIIQKFGADIFKIPVEATDSPKELLFRDALENHHGLNLLHELRGTLIGKTIEVPTTSGKSHFINLDNSASTPTFEPIWEAYKRTLIQPSSFQKEMIEQVKSICADRLGAPLDHYDIIFTSNTTEAINIAASGLIKIESNTTTPVIVNTIMEHSSNDLPWRMVSNGELIRLNVDGQGFINHEALKTLLHEYNEAKLHGKKRIEVVAVSGASNVLGSCNDLATISRLVHQYGARLLVDAAQLVAHKKVNMLGNGIDLLAFSAHKIYAPFGCGVLIARKGYLDYAQEEITLIKTSGEENAAGIAALGKAFVLLNRIGMEVVHQEEQKLTKKALSEMTKIPGLKIFGINDPDDPRIKDKLGVIVFGIRDMMPNKIAEEMAHQKGIGVRTGCHCAHLIVKQILNISPGLERFQRVIQTLFPKIRLPGVIRVSFGIENTIEDIEAMVETLNNIATQKTKDKNGQTLTALPASHVKKMVATLVTDAGSCVYERL